MSDAVIVALISLAGTVLTVLASAAGTRKKTKADLEEQIKKFRAESDESDAALNAKIDKLSEELGGHITQEAINDLKQRRVRIIRTADEISSGADISKAYCEDILEDIDWYESYCAAHPEYHNGKGHAAMQLIKQYYTESWRRLK